MAVLTISRQFGAGGWTLGEKLSQRFGFHFVDRSVIDKIAREEKVHPGWLDSIEKEASSRILNMLSSVVSSGIFYKSPGGTDSQEFERKRYVDCLTRIMKPMADKGGYIIVGRGAQFLLRGHPKVIHLMLVGDFRRRVDFLMKRYGITASEAESMIKDRERERIALASNVFNTNIDDPTLYDIVLNTCNVPFDWTFETISSLLALQIQRETGEPLSRICSIAP